MTLSAILGIVFVGLALASTFLMFQFWGYPYDEHRRKSSCPQWKMNVHRAVGFAYVAIYVVMLMHMVPRLWQYQIEFPARTVAHIMLGVSIGVILLLKLSILRWFRHFEEWMPALGVALLLCSVLLIALSLPASLRAIGGVGHEAFSDDNRARVRAQLEGAGFAPGTDLDALASEDALRAGRRVLLAECTFCHDLHTAIARPRTPQDWLRTVERMADKPTLGPVLEDDEIHAVTAYLVAITPDLQQSARAKRLEEEERRRSREALEDIEADDAEPDAATTPAPEPTPQPTSEPQPEPQTKPATKPRAKIDLVAAKKAFDRLCSTCHAASDTDDEPPRTRKAVDRLIERMIDNGLEAKKADLALVRAYLIATYAK